MDQESVPAPRSRLRADRPIRTGIGANLRTVHGEIDALQEPNIQTLLDDSLEEFQKERRFLKAAVPIPGKRGVVRNLLIEARPVKQR